MATLVLGTVSPTHADIVVDPNSTGATDITDLLGSPLDPTVGVLTSDGLAVGFDGDGELLIDNTGGLSAVLSGAGLVGANAGSTGKVTISGGAAWSAGVGPANTELRIGDEGDGVLIINNGGVVFSDFGEIGSQAGSSGEVTVSGSLSKWENSLTLVVGDLGLGKLTVFDGGKVTNSSGLIGAGLGGAITETSEVTVSGVDALGNPSAWKMTSILMVGNEKPGKLTIEDGGKVVSNSAMVGNSLNNTDVLGEVVVTGIHADGTRSLWQTHDGLRVGSSSKGTLSITDGARVITDELAIVGGESRSERDGQVSVSGKHANGTPSSWKIADLLRVGDVATGELTVDDEAQVSSAGGVIGVSNGDGSVTVTGPESFWNNTTFGLTVGAGGGAGKLTVTSGGTVTSVMCVNASTSTAAGTRGDIEVAGRGSKLQITGGGLSLGRDNVATLMITDGGLVTHTGDGVIGENATGNGQATVDGPGSRWELTGAGGFMVVGDRGEGRLTISNQGRVTNRVGEIGRRADSDSEVLVTGAGSLWENSSSLFVGEDGKGKLTIEAGGEARYGEATAIIGNVSGSTGELIVTGAGSVLNGGGLLFLSANSGNSTITVSDGGQINVPDAHIGSNGATAISTVSVQGVGSRLNLSNELEITGSGNGTLTVSDGGQVDTTDVLIGKFAGSFGRATVSSSLIDNNPTVLRTSGDMFVGGSATTGGGDGQLELSGDSDARIEIGGDIKIWGGGAVVMLGGVMVVDTIESTDGGIFDFQGGTLHADRFEGDLINQGGTVAPGPGLDSTLVIGDFTQDGDAKLAIEIGDNGSHDLISVTAAADLDGLLELTLDNFFVPESTDTITVLVADSLIGIFDNAINGQRIDTTDGGGSFVVNYGIGSPFGTDQIVLSDFEASVFLPGDFDQDGDVDGGDFLNWQRNDGSAIGLAAWEGNFGNVAPPLASSQVVPEPSTSLILLFGMMAMLLLHNQESF